MKSISSILACAGAAFLCTTAVVQAAEPDAAATPAVDHSAHAGHAAPPAGEMPGDSLYQLPVHFSTAGGDHLMLQHYRGEPVVVTMFYGTCKAACPLLIRAMTDTAASLPVADRDKVRFLMVTLDPERDTAEALQTLAREHGLAAPRFELARTDANGVRLLAASLGIRYRRLPDGNFSHSSILTALDGEGVPKARTERLVGADPDFVSAIAALAH